MPLDPAMLGQVRYKRATLDTYFTPPWPTRALIAQRLLRGPIWEPSAGMGHMAKVLKEGGFKVISTDIKDYGFKLRKVGDFFTIKPPSDFHSIVTNPPYYCVTEYIERALELTSKTGGMVALLLRNEIDSAAERRHLFSWHEAYLMKLVLLKRPVFINDQGLPYRAVMTKKKSDQNPRHNFAWHIWDWGRRKGFVPDNLAGISGAIVHCPIEKGWL